MCVKVLLRSAWAASQPISDPTITECVNRLILIGRLLVLLAPAIALIPLGRMVADWVEVASMLPEAMGSAPAGGFDWVLWQEEDGAVTATYVFPRGPAAEAGLQEGDVFYMLEYQQYFNADDLKQAIEGIEPGTRRTFVVQRGGDLVEATVELTRYPTFLYPLSEGLWRFSIWGFTLGVFLHVLGIVIAGPLALRSRRARFALGLILVSSLWMFANGLRLLLVDLIGPPAPGGTYDDVFQGLTLVGLVGWIGFPVLLLRKVLGDLELTLPGRIGRVRGLIYVPPLVLGSAALLVTLRGSLGPVTLDSLIAPILFYACIYIAAAAMLILVRRLLGLERPGETPQGWSWVGSAVTFVAALFVALSVLGVVPLFGAVRDTTVGWLVVSAQLLALAPVVLVSLATLKLGKVEGVLSRALTYVAVLGGIFLAFVGGLSLMEPYIERAGAPLGVVAGLYVLVLLLVFERLARRLRIYVAGFFSADGRRKRRQLLHLQDRMRTMLDHQTLAQQTVQVVGEAFGARSAVLFLRAPDATDAWIVGTYHPEPPYLTERLLRQVWPYMQEEGRIWARNPELCESALPPSLAGLLAERGAALAIPIMGDAEPAGLLALGPKKKRRALYNLDDLDQLRTLSAGLALAVERLVLVEREKALVRQSAEAQLVALRAQINPHFLFNALNTIISLIEERPEEAEATVEHLAAIFRHILQTGSRPFVTMEEEFSLVGHYLSIESARFGPKLHVDRHMEPAMRTSLVPAFAVQTLVENAIKHGLGPQREGGTLRLSCTRHPDGFAEVVVADTGVGIPSLFGQGEQALPEQPFFGIGLRNVSGRLQQIYGRGDLLRIRSTPGEGTVVRLCLPLSSPLLPSGDGRLDGEAVVKGK